jgi:hypothetical protein
MRINIGGQLVTMTAETKVVSICGQFMENVEMVLSIGS